MNQYYVLCAVVFAAAYLLNVTYISVFYHRGLTHRAVHLQPWLERFVVRTGSWITGLDPIGWTCMHRMHHQYSDTPLDPHSPTHQGIFGLAYGQLKSYKRVLKALSKKVPAYTQVVSDLPYGVNWLNRKKLWYLPYVIHAAVALSLGIFGGWWLLGAAYFYGMMSHPIQGWMVNALAHSKGYRNFKTGDDSTNNTFVAWFVFGEGFQNNHHRFPQSAKFSVKWFEYDMGYSMCLLMEKTGLLAIDRAHLATI